MYAVFRPCFIVLRTGSFSLRLLFLLPQLGQMCVRHAGRVIKIACIKRRRRGLDGFFLLHGADLTEKERGDDQNGIRGMDGEGGGGGLHNTHSQKRIGLVTV